MPTISRRLASAGTADPGDLKSPRLPGASPGSPTGVWLTGNSGPIWLKPEQPWECKSPHADQFGMSTGRASRTCLLNSGLPERGVWCESTAFRHSCARSSKRAGGLIPRIALDQCRVPERYRTRVPIFVPIAQCIEPARPKRQVVGERPAGNTSFAGVVQQQNAAVPRPRQRCDSVHPLHFHWECSSPAERSFDMREAERAALSAPTIFSRA